MKKHFKRITSLLIKSFGLLMKLLSKTKVGVDIDGDGNPDIVINYEGGEVDE